MSFHTYKTVLILTIAASLTAACSSNPTSENSGSTSAPNVSAQPNSASGGDSAKVTFKIFRNFQAPEYPADGGPAKQKVLAALDQAGIKGIDYNISMASGDEYKTKLNLLASSGDLPDYFSVPDLLTLNRLTDEGLILPLDDLLKNAPNVTKFLKPEDLDILKYKGKLYGLPPGYRPETFNGPNVNGLLIRQDWLDALKLKTPTTLDELHDVLKAFTFNDPDGNGKKDTFGITTNKLLGAGANGNYFSTVFGAFGVVPTFWQQRDGQLKQGMVLPETKQALALLQSWYKEGIIDPEFPIMEAKQMNEKIINSKAGIFEGTAFDADPTGANYSALKKTVATAKLSFLTPPAGAGGKKGAAENSPAYSDIRAISAKAKNPEKLMELINWSAGPGFDLVTYGIENEDYQFDKDKNKIKLLVPNYSELYKKGYSNPIRFLQVVDRRWLTEEATAAMTVSNDPQNLVHNEFWKSVQAMNDYPDIKKLWDEYFAKIVTGAWSVDKWDELVKRYYQEGGQEIEKQVNAEWKKVK
ncbi:MULTISPECIES: extracellular solute-binding protein [Paenibacillus]|uniref:Extracellular solute-binding protein n=1 Tax=Paenibacillus violae TaxID=3077234 RepID=A0ABU3RMF2_9BACL|nr:MULTISPECIES: extracellular solute-binding protein [Paenibacillus]MDU0205438.1 extracellular solute-binding protein [Paenibacillus sp. PFR10]MEC0268572.1 extracellular solute-binding protein [Paenibacillus anseongense]